MSCTDNAKISDSGYANTCDNSQSQRSSGSSLSRNSNRSESSGYCGGHPSSTLGSSSQALPQPINKKKDEEHKKKKSKTAAKLNAEESALKGAGQEMQYTVVPNELDELKKSDYLQEVGTVALVASTDPSDHINHTNFTAPAADLSSQSNPQDISSPKTNAEFYVVVSLSDGLVLHTSASLQTALGYPKDAWLGQSFIDFIQPKDKAIFTKKLTNNIALRFADHEKDLDGSQTSVFCNLQRCSTATLDSDTEPRDAKMCLNDKQITLAFSPFHLSLGFKQFRKFLNDEQSGVMLLTIKAQAVYSAYKVPDETVISPSIFVTQHNAACIISHVDDEIVRYSGYRPQDMIGRGVFNFFHPEDMALIKSIYETVVKLEGSTFTSKPYRFAVQNGGYVILETDWSSFINPWGKKLELIIGHHRVLRGPSNPDVFQPVTDDLQHIIAISEQILRKSNIIQEEIQTLLAQKIESATAINAHTEQSKDLVSFVDSLVHEAKQSATTSKAPEAMETEEKSLSEHDSVIFGDVSPHHEYCDSKSSSETPPSYNQLNYNEKLERFFNSQLTLASVYGADEENINSSTDGTGKTSQRTPSNRAAGNHDSGGSGSDENLTSASNNQASSASRNDSVNGDSHPVTSDSVKVPTLTEILLNIHNQDMEKLMVHEHKKRRSNNKNNKKKDAKNETKTSIQEGQEKLPTKSRAWKRSGNHSHEGDVIKKSKCENKLKTPKADIKAKKIDEKVEISNSTTTQPPAIIDIWPQVAANANLPNVSRCMVYYVPVPESKSRKINSLGQIWNPCPRTSVPQNSYVSYAATSLAGIIYPAPVVPAVSTSMMYGPTMVVNVAPTSSETIQKPAPLPECIRPPSQATSIKAEPGSVMCLSESSKKLLSPGGHFSSCVSVGCCSSGVDRQATVNNSESVGQSESSFEDSSDSSFYGSFLDTSSGSSNGHPNLLLSQDKNVSASRKGETTQLRHFGMIDGLKADFALQTARGVILPQELMQNTIPPSRFDATRQILVPAAPPWKTPVEVTPKFNFNYQITPRALSEVLKADAEALKKLTQPSLVNDQLEQLYRELELEGFSTKLILEGDSDSSNDDDHVRPETSLQQNCCSTKAFGER